MACTETTIVHTYSTILDMWQNYIPQLATAMGFDGANPWYTTTAVTPYWTVYQLYNLSGTQSTNYFYFTSGTNAFTMGLASGFNTTTRVASGTVATYGSVATGTFAAGTSYTTLAWKDSSFDPQWALRSIYVTGTQTMHSTVCGWCKFTPFSNFDGNKAATSLFFGTSASGGTGFTNIHTTGTTTSLGLQDTSGRFSVGSVGFGAGIGARGLNFDSKATLTYPVVVGQGYLPYGYINSTDLAVYTPGVNTLYTVFDRLVVTAGVEEYRPVYGTGAELYARVI